MKTQKQILFCVFKKEFCVYIPECDIQKGTIFLIEERNSPNIYLVEVLSRKGKNNPKVFVHGVNCADPFETVVFLSLKERRIPSENFADPINFESFDGTHIMGISCAKLYSTSEK